MKRISQTVKNIKGIDYEMMKKAQGRLDSLTKPRGSLGRLEELARQIIGITAKENPALKNKVVFTLAADHGVSDEKVSVYPREVTAQMVYNFLRGGAGINVLARFAGARVVVADMGVAEKIKEQKSKIKNFKDKKIAFGTRNMAKGPAMAKDEAVQSIEAGIELFEEEYKKGIDIAATGDMGIGNTTAASAITAAITAEPVEKVTGAGTGIDGQGLSHKIAVIKEALRMNNPDPKDAIGILSKVGGFEIGGLAGIILASASRRVPIVIDGFISGSAALIASLIEPKVKDYMIAAHCSAEKGHRVILNRLGLIPLLDLGLRLGEGTGAALGLLLAEASTRILTEMATFESAGVSKEI